MSEMDWLAKQMEKATQDHGRQQKQEERRACRQQLLSRIRSWCVLIVIALCVVFAVVYRERVSTLITTAYSSVFPGDKAAPGEKPGTGSSLGRGFNKAGQTIDKAAAAGEARDQVLNEIYREDNPGAEQGR